MGLRLCIEGVERGQAVELFFRGIEGRVLHPKALKDALREILIERLARQHFDQSPRTSRDIGVMVGGTRLVNERRGSEFLYQLSQCTTIALGTLDTEFRIDQPPFSSCGIKAP